MCEINMCRLTNIWAYTLVSIFFSERSYTTLFYNFEAPDHCQCHAYRYNSLTPLFTRRRLRRASRLTPSPTGTASFLHVGRKDHAARQVARRHLIPRRGAAVPVRVDELGRAQPHGDAALARAPALDA